MKRPSIYRMLMAILIAGLFATPVLSFIPAVSAAGDDAALKTERMSVPIKVLGATDKATATQNVLDSLVTNRSMITEDQLDTVRADRDILLVEESGLSVSRIAETKMRVQDLILEGVTVVLISDSPAFFNQPVNGFYSSDDDFISRVSQVYIDNSIVYGLKYDPVADASATFSYTPTLKASDLWYDALGQALSWAEGSAKLISDTFRANEQESASMMATASQTWQYATTMSGASSSDSTHGQQRFNTHYYRLTSDGNTEYNFYRVAFSQTNSPGSTGAPNEWRCADMWIDTGNINDRSDIHPTRWLIDCGPSFTQQGGAVSFSMSAAGPTFNGYYPNGGATVHSTINWQTPRAGWWHDVDELGSGREVRTVTPGMEIQTEQARGGYYEVMHDTYSIHWMNLFWWPLVQNWNVDLVASGRVNPPNPMS